MTFIRDGFRPIYKNLSVFPYNDIIKASTADLPGADTADCALCYGFIDINAGITIEVLALGHKNGEEYEFFDTNQGSRCYIRVEELENDEFENIEGEKAETLADRYISKLNMLDIYDVSEEQDDTRFMEFLDGCRHRYCVDNVSVTLTRQGVENEDVWVRIVGNEENFLVGILQTEPTHSFGVHKSEKIALFLYKTDDDKIACMADLNPRLSITPEDLEDGSMLKNAIEAFVKERNEENTLDVLELLRDSRMRVMCNGFNLTPDLVKNGDVYYFPVFTSDKEMGAAGKGQQKIERNFLDCIAITRKNSHEIAGIVVNPFTIPFILDKSYFEVIERMPSSFIE